MNAAEVGRLFGEAQAALDSARDRFEAELSEAILWERPEEQRRVAAAIRQTRIHVRIGEIARRLYGSTGPAEIGRAKLAMRRLSRPWNRSAVRREAVQ